MQYRAKLRHEAMTFVRLHIIEASMQNPLKRTMIQIYFACLCLALVISAMYIPSFGIFHVVLYFGIFAGLSIRGLLHDQIDSHLATALGVTVAMFVMMLSICLKILF